MDIKGKDVSLVIAGEAGQGIQTIERLLIDILHHSGYYVFSTKEYMSRVRGGSNSTTIRISSHPVQAFVNRIDILIVLDKKAFDHVSHRVTNNTIIIGDDEHVSTLSHPHVFTIDIINKAKNIGNKVYVNTIAVGLLASLFHIPHSIIEQWITLFFQNKSKEVVKDNLLAINKGQDLASQISGSVTIPKIAKKRKNESSVEILLNGTQAIGLGALAGGCNFISSYPMSPSTGVLNFLSTHADKANVFVEQAEDEIAAINMAVGAWYAGARAVVTTSGGGFALMGEGLSLAAMTETPLVVHLAQRPGPATGLPTRTEQGDLHLALYAGHGEFPRVIYAPGNLQEGFLLTKKAFDIADNYQIPVIILSDQYFIDSMYQTKQFIEFKKPLKHHIVKTTESYHRYADTKTGVSPRGIPGYGTGFVCVDSDEHDEHGRITESATVRKQMVEKRLRKNTLLKEESIAPTVYGAKNFKIILVSWGSTLPIIDEARTLLDRPEVSLLHFSQVYPLHVSSTHYLQNAEKIISIENNATGQFTQLLQQETDTAVDAKILQYTGHPFSVETLIEKISATIHALEEAS